MSVQPANQLIKEVQTAQQHLGKNNRDEAVRIYETISGQAGEDIQLNVALGHLCINLGAPERAIKHYRVAVDVDPDEAVYQGYLGVALENRGKYGQAYHTLHHALEQGDDSYNVLHSLGNVYLKLGLAEGARDYYERAVAKKPSLPNARLNLAQALMWLNDHATALDHVHEVLKRGTDTESVHSTYAEILGQMGRVDEAVAHLEKTVQRHKTFGNACNSLANLKKFSSDDHRFIAKTEKMLGRSMPPEQREGFHFALGKMYDDCKQHEAAFEHYRKANTLRKRFYDVKKDLQVGRSLKKMFNRSTLDRLQGLGHESRQPVFVVGMPRSGTTLIERIIAAHPQGAGAGELPTIKNLREQAVPRTGGRRARGKAFQELTADTIHEYAERYLEELRGNAGENAERVVDKMPGNFFALGFISTLFPNATIIHAVRHPLDIALSCYFQRFNVIPWANDFSDIAAFYRVYREMITYWKNVLPEGRIVDVHYELLVQEPEREGARLLQACGLEWDHGVLDFHQQKGVVRTASVSQVRRPIYQSSQMRWTAYGPYLGELAQELAPWLPETADELRAQGVPVGRGFGLRRGLSFAAG